MVTRRTLIIIIIHEVVLSNALRRQKTASKEQQSAADNERLCVFSLTLTEILLPSSPRHQFIHNEDKRYQNDLRKVKKC